MPEDKGWHRKTRLEIIDFLKENGYHPISSHTKKGKGNISLYIKNRSLDERLSQPDIVIPKKRKKSYVKYIIEIEGGSPSPKEIFGIISTVNLSKICKKGNRELRLKNAKLIVVVTDKAMYGEEERVPHKQSQFANIQRIAKEKLLGNSLRDFIILSELEFFDFRNIDEIFV